ncbi:MAG: hypothetical protein J1E98_03055 [Lachnospiraceae bacterium]|nr:hypothetical protein [Lachnospiraceae bacterium]
MIRKIKEDLHLETIQKWEWIFLIGVVLILASLYLYEDITVTSAKGFTVWSCLFEGKLNSFYNYLYPGVENSYIPNGVSSGAYDFCIYIIFALYNFPMWVWEKFTGYSVFMFFPTRLYVKGIVWLFTAISGYVLHKIALCCGVNRNSAKWCVFLFLSSGFFFYSEVVIGGYDIISVSFTLLGIYGFLVKNHKCFLISFAIAIASKLFALWIFIPLLLLREKRIRYLFLNILGAVSLIVIPKLYFAVSNGQSAAEVLPAESGGASIIAHSNLVNEFLFPQAEFRQALIKLHDMPLIFVGMFIIWILCYFCNRELSCKQIIYLCTVVMSVFVLTSKIHPYWIILLTPYIILTMSFDLHDFDKNAILEILMAFGYVCRMSILWPSCSNLNLIYYMLQPDELLSDKGIGAGHRYGLNVVLDKLSEMSGISLENISSLFGALFVAALLVFLYQNFPKEKEDSTEIDYSKVRLYTYLRIVVSVCIGLLPVGGYIIWKIKG